jgi:hypothetical protein
MANRYYFCHYCLQGCFRTDVLTIVHLLISSERFAFCNGRSESFTPLEITSIQLRVCLVQHAKLW